jgi:hypothetical protein
VHSSVGTDIVIWVASVFCVRLLIKTLHVAQLILHKSKERIQVFEKKRVQSDVSHITAFYILVVGLWLGLGLYVGMSQYPITHAQNYNKIDAAKCNITTALKLKASLTQLNDPSMLLATYLYAPVDV